MKNSIPLILDLDGTLISNDITHDLFSFMAFYTPLDFFHAVKLGFSDKPSMKRFMLDRHEKRINPDYLPYSESIIALAKAYKSSGGDVYLCSGSHEMIVDRIVQHFDWLDGGWGTRDELNMTAHNKAEFLKKQFPTGFHYVGNSEQDFQVWEAAQKGYAINPPQGVEAIRTAQNEPIEILERQTKTLKAVLKAMRVHQWAKNGLMFVVPLLTFAELSISDIVNVILGFLAFSLLASSTYILNDLVDINSDRQHATKRNRMLASGRLSVPHAVILIALLGVLSLVIAAFLPINFLATMALYCAVTLIYSFKVKLIAIADVMTLAGLFTLRVVAGATLVLQPVSPWLLNFIAVLFLNLALVKRYTELRKKPTTTHAESSAIVGRGYTKNDEVLVLALGVSMASLALLSFFLYGLLAPVRVIDSGIAIGAIATILLYWMMRVWLLAHRGLMDDDPVLFAIKDRLSIVLGLLVCCFVVTASIF